jgi:ribosomal protein S18 acetylase RimI-like enzyme
MSASAAGDRLYLRAVTGKAVDLYSAAFAARYSRAADGHLAPLIEPGVCAVVPHDERTIRLLVIDDRAYGRLTTDVATAGQGVVNVFDSAPRCDEFMRRLPGWRAERPATAMVCRDIDAVPAATLPDGLVLRPVNRLGSQAPGAVPLGEAVAVAVASDPGIIEPADEFARFLRGLPSSVRLFAAVNGDGMARATSGCDVFGEDARIFFVNTEPDWRGRGIGSAMTREALRAAARSGAHRAVLDSTDAAASLYMRLGFEVAGRLARYSR